MVHLVVAVSRFPVTMVFILRVAHHMNSDRCVAVVTVIVS
jgi:hypothetical protein